MSGADEINKLADLKDRKVISQKEFDRKKAQILAGQGTLLPSQQAQVATRRFSLAKLLAAAVIAAVVLTISSQNGSNPHSEKVAQTTTTNLATPVSPAASDIDRLRRVMPLDQATFVRVIDAARDQFATGANDLAKGAARPARARALCGAIPSRGVTGWAGRVTNLSTNGDGKGVLTLEIGPGLSVKTWNNALSDIGDRTLIEPDTRLFSTATALQNGQVVRFDGHFLPSATDCFKEASMSLAGSIREPEFIFVFQSIYPTANL